MSSETWCENNRNEYEQTCIECVDWENTFQRHITG